MSDFDWSNPIVKQVCERYAELNRKATPEDATASHKVRDTATYYAETYEGAFSFMLSMKRHIEQFNKLPLERVPSVINCMMFEYKQRLQGIAPVVKPAPTLSYPTAELPNLPAEIAAHKAAEQTPQRDKVSIRELPIKGTCSVCGVVSDVAYDTSLTASCVNKAACEARRNTPMVPQCKNGTYTIVLDETGDYRTIKLSDVPESYNKAKGTQIASYLSGSDNDTNYTGFAFVTGSKFELWKRTLQITGKAFEHYTPLTKALTVLLSAERETQIDMGHAYAIESGACFICGRKLTVPASLHRGMGPICAEKY